MAIKLNTVERGQSGMTGGGEKKFYISAITDGEIFLEISRLERSNYESA